MLLFTYKYSCQSTKEQMKTNDRFYTYAYLREDGSPYYIGKGRGRRAYQQHKVNIPPKERILFLKKNITEEDAIKHEKYMIFIFGRKDLGTGILRNLTDGGEGMSGYKHSEKFIRRMKINNPTKNPEVCKKISQKLSGENNPMYGVVGENHPCYGKPKTKESIEKRTKSFCKNTYAIISPDGEKFITKNMAKFCREHNLDKSSMSSVSKRKISHHKGWVCCLMNCDIFPDTLIKYEPKIYELLSPSGEKHMTTNLKEFCENNNLQHSEMYRIVNKKRTHHKGWTV